LRRQGSALVHFIRNDAHVIVACDFFVAATARFRILYIFVALEIGSRRLVHFNVTERPTADWTLQQLREALLGDGDCKFLLHDWHKTFSASLDEEVGGKLGHPHIELAGSYAYRQRALRALPSFACDRKTDSWRFASRVSIGKCCCMSYRIDSLRSTAANTEALDHLLLIAAHAKLLAAFE
jgi:hypothetical protein